MTTESKNNLGQSLKTVLEYAEQHENIPLQQLHGFKNILSAVEAHATKEENELMVNHVKAIRSYMKNGEDDAEINEAIDRVIKSMRGYNDARYLASNITDNTKSVNLFIGLHEKEKLLDQIVYSAERDGLNEVAALGKKLQNVFDDMYKIINGKIKIDDDVLLKKYSHNISGSIKPNKYMNTLNSSLMEESVKNGYATKEFIGNKGANLVEMHKLGINVPKSIFLSTVACKSIYDQQDVSFMYLLNKIMYMFDTDLIAIRSSGVVSMAGMMDTVLNVNRKDEEAVKAAILNVVNSWDSDKAKSFRKICKIDDEIKVSIVIQGMVRGDIGCSGIVFSRNPNNGSYRLHGEYLDKQFGDKLANGSITPKEIGNFQDTIIDRKIYDELDVTASKLEKHFKAVQDIEFVNDGEKTYFVQTRDAQLTPLARIRTLIDFYQEGIIELDEFKRRYNPEIHKKVISFEVFGGGGHLLRGTPAVNGIFTGIATFKRETANENNILIVDSTSPEDMPYLNKIGALVTKIGGMTSHPAVVCRQLNKPCIVGISSLNFNKSVSYLSVHFNQGHGEKEICEGDVITIVGDSGDIYEGKCEVKQKQLFVGEVNEILNTEELITVRELYFKCDLLDGTERLKPPFIEINKAIHKNNLNRVIEIVNLFIEKCSEDISMMRMLLNAIKPVSDEQVIIPLHKKLLEIIESKIGKIN